MFLRLVVSESSCKFLQKFMRHSDQKSLKEQRLIKNTNLLILNAIARKRKTQTLQQLCTYKSLLTNLLLSSVSN
jgi:hypothetical protein